MPKVTKKEDTTPKNLRPYIFHGVNLDWKEGTEQATGECPFCQRDGKFSVNIESGLWRCFVCAEGNEKGGGNPLVFIRKLFEAAENVGTDEDYEALKEDRTLLSVGSLKAWGVRMSPTTNDWLIPGYDASGKLSQLYRYINGKLLPTPGSLGHGVHLIPKQVSGNVVYVCEGPWDAIAFWEVSRQAKVSDEGLKVTGNVESSLLGEAFVVAVPGCGSVGEPFKKWLKLFEGNKVVLLFDSDFPREINGKTIEPAGFAATKRAVGLLSRAEQQPSSVEWLEWGPEGFDLNFKDGYDIRDVLSSGLRDDLKDRLNLLGKLLKRVVPIPGEWVTGRSGDKARVGSVELEPAHCDNWKDLVTAWRKALRWTDGLDNGLAFIAAVAASTKVPGDQLWGLVTGPASCGKSTLCEAFSVAKRFVFANSTMTGIHSGWKTDQEGKEDHSLVAKINGKTLIIKDGDTLLQSMSKDKILSELRDIYDRVSRVHYNNGISRAHEGIDMTLIICGTGSLRSLDTSELGERFLKCVIMEGIDDDLEEEILNRKVNQVIRNIGMESNGEKSAASDPDLTKAMQLTGGYVEYLRENAAELLSQVDVPEPMRRKCQNYGKFVSFMRARPSKVQEETAEREMAARLVVQITRLACCLCVVLNRKTMDEDVLKRVKAVTLDTARGVTLDVVAAIHKAGADGAVVKHLSVTAHVGEVRCRELLRFLRRIGCVEVNDKKINGVPTQPRWRLSERFARLYEDVVE